MLAAEVASLALAWLAGRGLRLAPPQLGAVMLAAGFGSSSLLGYALISQVYEGNVQAIAEAVELWLRRRLGCEAGFRDQCSKLHNGSVDVSTAHVNLPSVAYREIVSSTVPSHKAVALRQWSVERCGQR